MMTEQTDTANPTIHSAANFWFVESYVKSCPQCGIKDKMLTTFGAAEFLDLPIYEIYRKAETGEIHTVATSHGLLLVCRRSLMETV